MPDPSPEGDRPRGLSSGREPEPPGERGSRAPRVLPRALAALIALAAAVYLLGLAPGGGSFAYDGPLAPSFEISWSELDQVEPRDHELLRLERDRGGELLQRLTVLPLPPPHHPPVDEAGALSVLALNAEATERYIRTTYPGARIVLEGLGRLEIRGGREAYQVAFYAPASEGGLLLGKVLQVPEDADASAGGVGIVILERTTDESVIERAQTSPATFFFNWPSPALLEDEAAIQTEPGLEEPLRSFDFL